MSTTETTNTVSEQETVDAPPVVIATVFDAAAYRAAKDMQMKAGLNARVMDRITDRLHRRLGTP